MAFTPEQLAKAKATRERKKEAKAFIAAKSAKSRSISIAQQGVEMAKHLDVLCAPTLNASKDMLRMACKDAAKLLRQLSK